MPSDHVRDSDGFHTTVGGELESSTRVARAVEPHRNAGLDVFDEEFTTRILVNPYSLFLKEDREVLAAVLVPRSGCVHASSGWGLNISPEWKMPKRA